MNEATKQLLLEIYGTVAATDDGHWCSPHGLEVLEILRQFGDDDDAVADFCGLLVEEIERLRKFIATQPCDCYDRMGKRKSEPCERCRIVYGRETETWIEFKGCE